MQPIAFSNIFYLAVSVLAFGTWFVPEMIGLATQQPKKGADVRDRRSGIAVRASMITGIWLAIFLATLVPDAAIPWARIPIFWAGIACMLGGGALRWYSIRQLGQYFTRQVATRAGQEVIQTGPYRLLRHPSYTGVLMVALGIGLALGSWAGLVVIVLLPLAGLSYRMHVEEQVLLDGLGEPYREYMSRTRRIIPFVY